MGGRGHNKHKAPKPKKRATDTSPANITPIKPAQEEATEKKCEDKIQEHNKNSKKGRMWHKPESPVAVATLVAAITVAIIYFCQLRVMQKQLDTTQINFLKDQRPVVYITKTYPPHIQPGEKICWNFDLINYGRSPAVGVLLTTQVVYGPNSYSQVSPAVFSDLHNGKPHTHGDLMPPTKPDHGTSASIDSISAEDFDYIMKHDLGAVVVGRFEYFDLTGDKVQTDFGFGRQMTGDISKVAIHNELHEDYRSS